MKADDLDELVEHLSAARSRRLLQELARKKGLDADAETRKAIVILLGEPQATLLAASVWLEDTKKPFYVQLAGEIEDIRGRFVAAETSAVDK